MTSSNEHMLYIVRHGDAESPSVDPARPLSAKGREEVFRIASWASNQGYPVREIRCSTKLRAKQTAEIFVETFGLSAPPTEISGLSPDDAVGPLADDLVHEESGLMLVSHLPLVGRLASLLVTGSDFGEVVYFDTATLAVLAKEEGGYRLVCTQNPREL